MSFFEDRLKRVLERSEARRQEIPLEALVPGPYQPRRRHERLDDLAASIRERGVLQPLLVRPLENGRFQIVAGERRWRAAKMAGLASVPALVREMSDEDARLLALVENLQREDLNPFEETIGILELLSARLKRPVDDVVSLLQRMWNEHRGKVTQNVLGNPEARTIEDTFKELGRLGWESFVQARLPLLKLPEDLKAALIEGALPYTAALELKKLTDPDQRASLLALAIEESLSVREVKARVAEILRAQRDQSLSEVARDYAPRLRSLALRLKQVPSLPQKARSEIDRHLKAIEEILKQV